jgi:Tat protein secretion system quality control protein TatD with DNase activity
LIESDWNDCVPHGEAMFKILGIISEVKGWSLRDAATKTTENALNFFGLE